MKGPLSRCASFVVGLGLIGCDTAATPQSPHDFIKAGDDGEDAVDAGAPDGAAPTPDAPPAIDATTPVALDAGDDGCAVAPVDAWAGHAHTEYTGFIGNRRSHADVTWVLVSRVGCIDRFEPVGTVTHQFVSGAFPCTDWRTDPGSAAIARADGTLVVDRRVRPATFEASGTTRWPARTTCVQASGETFIADDTGAGPWLAAAGKLDGGRVAGSAEVALCDEFSACSYSWSFAAVE